MSEPDIHTCHAGCPCHTGGEPLPDFVEELVRDYTVEDPAFPDLVEEKRND